MKVKTDVDLILAGFGALYIVLTFPQGLLILTAVVAVAVYLYTKSMRNVVGTFALMILLNFLTSALTPKVIKVASLTNTVPEGFQVKAPEGFQVKDPVSIHQRIKEAKKGAPLNPKVSQISGVLESPEILDSLQISEIDSNE